MAAASADVGPRIAVVGTGVAALMCTRTLAQMAKAGKGPLRGAKIAHCTSRGKLATQMGPKNQTAPVPGKPFFDYGCQYFTADVPWFREEVERWAALGLCQALPAGQIGTVSSKEGFKAFPADDDERSGAKGTGCFVGNGGMGPMLTKLIEQMAQEFAGTVEHVSGFPEEARKVVGLRKDGKTGLWDLVTKAGKTLGPFDLVIGGFAQHILTDPFLKSGGASSAAMLQCLRRVESNQIIPIQVAFEATGEGNPLPMPFTAAHVLGEEPLAWVCDNSKKPQQDGRKVGTPGCAHLTLLSTAKFAEEQFQLNSKGYKREAEVQMFAALARVLRISDSELAKLRPRVNRINHWEDGVAVNTPPESRGCLLDVEEGLGWCGDFCVAPGLQGAAASGRAMAETLAEFWTAKQNGKTSSFDKRGLLPADEAWAPIGSGETEVSVLDMGGFAKSLGLRHRSTHTDLVPSAIGGYDPAAQLGGSGGYAAARGKGSGKGKGRGKAAETPEKRRAPDGKNYTKSEFRTFYGGFQEWDKALGA